MGSVGETDYGTEGLSRVRTVDGGGDAKQLSLVQLQRKDLLIQDAFIEGRWVSKQHKFPVTGESLE
jgi:hypothetical protein